MREFTHRVLITGKRCNLGFLVVYLICKSRRALLVEECGYV